MRMAPRFMRAMAAASIMWRVSGRSTVCRLTKSDSARTVSRGAQVAFSSASTSGIGAHEVVVEDAHPEAQAAARHLPTDAPEADEAECGAVDVLAQQQQRSPGLPTILAHEVSRLGQTASGRHEQREGQVGGRLREHTRGVADLDAAAGTGCHVDVVVAHGEVGDDAKSRPGRVEQVVVHAVREQREQSIHASHLLQEHVPGRRQLTGPDLHLRGGRHDVQATGGDGTGDEDTG